MERRRGRFDYDLPESLGGGSDTRANAAERELGTWIGLGTQGRAGALRLRGELSDLERGLPGPMHAPTPSARQDVRRTQLAASWRAAAGGTSVRMDAHAGWQRLRFEDAEPPLGQPYFDTTRVRDTGVRVELERTAGASAAFVYGLGAEMRWTRLESSTLEPGDLTYRQPGVFARGALEVDVAPVRPALSLAVRADRWDGAWTLSHDAALTVHAGPATLSAAHRSAFSPPSPGDQFFRGGFAIEPNPALEPERVPSEVELSLSTALRAGALPLQLGVSAFRSDIDGMIVWSPDFRFVWSPRNTDVLRRGGEAWLRAGAWRGVEASAWASVARVTYDWPGDADTVQVAYRPRYSGGADVDWRPGAWRVGASALYTGLRYATPGQSNPLPAFWELDAVVSREWLTGPLRTIAALRVDRLLDNTDSFVHGYPQPGRTLRLELRVQAADAAFSDLSETGT